ncbi:hypothetical protein O181_119945 [Austropuccinia psidii MF-1]|uniref:Reverse transcriptase Ty1/copia-type domain-containing protein n=1 Tax=Austropuccinia psidii MF-1 TaxID=1389203 RepID=A0A9Q3KEY1_9BASI|nr:hypothetical protein [Austropuccinia psidii MF-1]
MYIYFLVYSFSLGSFKREENVESQDMITENLLVTTPTVPTPKTVLQEISSPEKEKWEEEIEEELVQMKDMGVYEILPLPWNTNVLGGGWVFVKKPGMGSAPVCFKARYVA